MSITRAALTELDERCEEIRRQLRTAEQSIEDTERVIELRKITHDKLKALAVQSDELEMVQVQLQSCLHFIREDVKPGNEEYVLRMKRATLERVKELLVAPLCPDKLKPIAEADILLLAEDKYTQAFLRSIEKHFQKCGSIDRYLAHLVFVGLPGSGKTTFISRLLDCKEAEEMCLACAFGVTSGIITVEVVLSEDTAASLHAVRVSKDCKWVKTSYRMSCLQQMTQEFTTVEVNSGAHENFVPYHTRINQI